MRKILYSFVAFILIAGLAGCSTLRRPGSVPELGLDVVGAFSEGYSVKLVNDQQNATPQSYGSAGMNVFLANYNEWTQFFIDDLSKEFIKRGVDVSNNSLNELRVKLSGFQLLQGFAVVRVNMRIDLEMPGKNWSKEMFVTDKSGWNDGRAFASVIYHSIEEILKKVSLII